MRPSQMPKDRSPDPATRGDAVRRRLLDAAVELIPEVGWHAVRTRALAERAGVTPGLVHYHFGTLGDLLRAAAVEAVEAVLAEALGAVADATTPEEGVDALLAALDAHSGTDAASLLFSEAYLAATRDEELRGALAGLLAAFDRRLAGWLAGCGHADAAGTAAVLSAALDGVVLHRALDPQLTAQVVAPALHRLVGTGSTGGTA